MKHIWKKDSIYYQQWKEFRLQPNAWDKDSSTTKGFWVPLLQILLYTIHQHNFSLQVYVSNTLPKACIYMGKIRNFSKVEEVIAVMEIKVNELTNLQSVRVFVIKC